MTILPFPSRDDDSTPDTPSSGAELVVAPHHPKLGRVRGWLERQPPLPSSTHIAQRVHWWRTDGLKKIGALVVRSPVLLFCEAVPICRGLSRILGVYARWVMVADYDDTISAAEGNTRTKHAAEVRKYRSNNRRLSAIAFVVLGGTSWWGIEEHPGYMILTGIGIACICDVVGRRGTTKTDPALPPADRMILREGVPLYQITTGLITTAQREGLKIGIAKEMRYDAARREYRLSISCQDEIKPDHLRAFERGIGAADHTIRNLATDVATIRELVIRDGDPLAEYAERSWIDTGSMSITESLDMGVSLSDVPFALTFAGVHVKCVGSSGSGKTKWFLRTLIDRLSACRDCVIWGIDLNQGEELPLWRRVIQRVAYLPEDAEEVLDAAIDEITRRGKILAAFAADDDPNNNVDGWNSNLGPALTVVVDEFSLLAAYDGKNGKLNLLGKCETVVRIGRKYWVSMIMLTQKTGNSDFGSTVMVSQCATSVMLACSPADTVTMVGVERRDMGYAPHLFSPGVEGDARDAGKCFLESPRHRTPDIYRAYAPGTNAEVKRRAQQRIADGLPDLHGRDTEPDDVVEAQEVPTILVNFEQAFTDSGNPKRLHTADLLEWLNGHGYDLDGKRLSDMLRPAPICLKPSIHRWRKNGKGESLRGYYLADVREALGRFGA